MDTQEYLDKLYQQWTKTTGAETRFWIVEAEPDVTGEVPGFAVYAMDQEQNKQWVAWFLSEEDADFVAGIHGAVADLVRVTNTALDEAESSSLDRDQQEGRIADLELERQGLTLEVGELARENEELHREILGLKQALEVQ